MLRDITARAPLVFVSKFDHLLDGYPGFAGPVALECTATDRSGLRATREVSCAAAQGVDAVI